MKHKLIFKLSISFAIFFACMGNVCYSSDLLLVNYFVGKIVSFDESAIIILSNKAQKEEPYKIQKDTKFLDAYNNEIDRNQFKENDTVQLGYALLAKKLYSIKKID